MSRNQWKGSRRGRAIVAPLVAAGVGCCRCGRPILPGQKWDVDHILPRALGGGEDATNYGAAHAACNRAEGGRRGARITNARRLEDRQLGQAELPIGEGRTRVSRATERTRGIRGVN